MRSFRRVHAVEEDAPVGGGRNFHLPKAVRNGLIGVGLAASVSTPLVLTLRGSAQATETAAAMAPCSPSITDAITTGVNNTVNNVAYIINDAPYSGRTFRFTFSTSYKEKKGRVEEVGAHFTFAHRNRKGNFDLNSQSAQKDVSFSSASPTYISVTGKEWQTKFLFLTTLYQEDKGVAVVNGRECEIEFSNNKLWNSTLTVFGYAGTAVAGIYVAALVTGSMLRFDRRRQKWVLFWNKSE